MVGGVLAGVHRSSPIIERGRNMAAMNPACERWPTYRSIKLLKAMQITSISYDTTDFATLHMADGSEMKVNPTIWFVRYAPSVGDYVICYEGGEEIICSKLDFETGYARA